MVEPIVKILIPKIRSKAPKRNITITPDNTGAREMLSSKTIAQIGKTECKDSLIDPYN
jgi:hypothetical protein